MYQRKFEKTFKNYFIDATLIITCDRGPKDFSCAQFLHGLSYLSALFGILILLIFQCAHHAKWFYDPEGGVVKKIYKTKCLNKLKEKAVNLKDVVTWFNNNATKPRPRGSKNPVKLKI